MKVLSNSNIHQLVRTNVVARIKKSKLWLKYNSTSDNVYHCCVHKTASQWIKSLLADSRIQKYSNLSLYSPDSEQLKSLGGYNLKESNSGSTVQAFPQRWFAAY